MKKYKMGIFFSLISVLLVLLTGCGGTTNMKSVSEPVKEAKKEHKIYEDTLEIGTTFYTYFEDNYVYSGVVNDSILITILKDDSTNHSNNLPMYIPISRKSPIELPHTSVSIQIKEVNKEDGTIKMTLIEKNK